MIIKARLETTNGTLSEQYDLRKIER